MQRIQLENFNKLKLEKYLKLLKNKFQLLQSFTNQNFVE